MDPLPKKLLDLTNNIYNGELILPEFQRSFVWDNTGIKDLLVSVLSGYFIGTFLLMRRQDEFGFMIRYFEGVDVVNQKLPSKPNAKNANIAVLDGQQRLSTLFYVLHHPTGINVNKVSSPYRYFLRIENGFDKKQWEWDNIIWSVSETNKTKNISIDFGDGKKRYSFNDLIKKASGFDNLLKDDRFQEYCYHHIIIPFSYLKENSLLTNWLEYMGNFKRSKGAQDEEILEMKTRINEKLTKWFDFQVPTITLEGVAMYEVAEIFTRINRTGVELSIFALATAVHFEKGVNLRDCWEEYYEDEDNLISKYCKKNDEQYAQYILQIMALLQDKGVGKKILIDKNFDVNKRYWDKACSLLTKSLRRLEAEYRVFGTNYLPHKPIVPALAGLLNLCESNKDYEKLDAWYWSSIVDGRYHSSSETKVKQDFDDVSKWLESDEQIPEVVTNINKSVSDLKLTSKKTGGFVKAIFNLTALNKATDFYNGQLLELNNLNDHHIFPKKSGINMDEPNSIVNRTLIAETTNKKIKNSKPSVYIEEMKKELGGEAKLLEVLSSHFINGDALKAIRKDDIEGFLKAREKEIIKELKRRVKYPNE